MLVSNEPEPLITAPPPPPPPPLKQVQPIEPPPPPPTARYSRPLIGTTEEIVKLPVLFAVKLKPEVVEVADIFVRTPLNK